MNNIKKITLAFFLGVLIALAVNVKGSQEVINIGAVANDGTGDDLRTAFDKTNNNFTELYSLVRSAGNVAVTTGANSVNFSSAFTSGSYSLIVFDINGVGVDITSQTVNGFAVTALGDGVINYIAILNI